MRRGIGAAALGLAGMLAMSHAARAVPAFSRQIHAGCDACHFQGMGSLNRFGRAFMMNNFRLTPRMRRELLERKKREREKPRQARQKKDR